MVNKAQTRVDKLIFSSALSSQQLAKLIFVVTLKKRFGQETSEDRAQERACLKFLKKVADAPTTYDAMQWLNVYEGMDATLNQGMAELKDHLEQLWLRRQWLVDLHKAIEDRFTTPKIFKTQRDANAYMAQRKQAAEQAICSQPVLLDEVLLHKLVKALKKDQRFDWLSVPEEISLLEFITTWQSAFGPHLETVLRGEAQALEQALANLERKRKNEPLDERKAAREPNRDTAATLEEHIDIANGDGHHFSLTRMKTVTLTALMDAGDLAVFGAVALSALAKIDDEYQSRLQALLTEHWQRYIPIALKPISLVQAKGVTDQALSNINRPPLTEDEIDAQLLSLCVLLHFTKSRDESIKRRICFYNEIFKTMTKAFADSYAYQELPQIMAQITSLHSHVSSQCFDLDWLITKLPAQTFSYQELYRATLLDSSLKTSGSVPQAEKDMIRQLSKHWLDTGLDFKANNQATARLNQLLKTADVDR
ncbi:hypothetical protein FE810_15435 [Thalassotalea litorea]|uniref:Uncharacterized protein n=1 Tax=Thalassotalea litorea TaxID=2020715 RepID=A0A5R9ICX9_9GAMM|nr:hypothetical protein [Thalassotalea litorea]TLU61213.1 hypothetical protein FE810_15435 [Thalassotalea litorea]